MQIVRQGCDPSPLTSSVTGWGDNFTATHECVGVNAFSQGRVGESIGISVVMLLFCKIKFEGR